MLPALANKVTPNNVPIPQGLSNLFAVNWLYGFVCSVILFYILHKLFPDHSTLIPATIYGDEATREVVGGSDANTAAEKGVLYTPPLEVTDKE